MLNKKDPYLLLSVVNTKLRDEADSLEELCKTYDQELEVIVERLSAIGYHYEKAHNQFVAV